MQVHQHYQVGRAGGRKKTKEKQPQQAQQQSDYRR